MSLSPQDQNLPERLAPGPVSHLTPSEVARAVRAVDATAFFVLPRVLRRVIKQDCRLTGLALRVAHRKSYAIDAGPLLEIVERGELSPDDGAELPERVILLPSPDPEKTAEAPAGEVLARYWRLLFHMHVHAAMDRQVASGRLTSSVTRQRIQQIGPAEFDEIRLVLHQEDFLLPPQSDVSCYIEFAAVYLELRQFAGNFLPRYFPGSDDSATVDAVLAQDVDAEVLFRATRPAGAVQPIDRCEIDHWSDSAEEHALASSESDLLPKNPSESTCRAMLRKARRPASVGNVVRAAICHARAEQSAPPGMVGQVRAAIRMDIDRLIRRLQAALELDAAGPQPWWDSLLALVRQTVQGLWTPESRLLYDLQKVCIDYEREIYTVDVVEWALAFGRRPIKRPLPHQRDVLMSKHLRIAARRLAVVRLTEVQQEQLALLIQRATERVETRLRERLRPTLAAALDGVGLTPKNTPESVARKKLIEELLDQVVERGFLTMGALRDAISRNNLKLPDISELAEFFRGDQLLRADRRLAVSLDGVYYAGEFYLRWMQRFSSLAFGTGIGRFVTRFAAVPFGGAYLALAGLHHLVELAAKVRATGAGEAVAQAMTPLGEEAVRSYAYIKSPMLVVALGLFLVGLINSAGFRRVVARFFGIAYRVLRTAIVDPIRWVIRSELLQRVLRNRLFLLLLRLGIKPAVWTAAAWWLLPLSGPTWQVSAGRGISIFLAVNLLLNSRLGRNTEELIADWLVQTWHRVGMRIITGMFWLIVDVFQRILETVEWLMYTVDEWLRFRSGQGAAVLGLKAVFGVAWFFVAYVLRFSVNLLIEPQINPIKHFPVVTVSHKLLWPLVPGLAGLLENTLEKGWALTIAGMIITCVPGIFGFLVWELKENWRLYAANRQKQLGATPIGAHGETMARFLRSGFHSGTLPKRFAKLRRAERKARAGGRWRPVRKHVHALRHVEASIQRHVERAFNALIAESRCWQGPAFTLERVQAGATGVKLAFAAPSQNAGPLHVAIAVQSGWLVANVAAPGWANSLLPHQRQILTTALIGLYKSAGVDLVRQQIDAAFRPAAPAYDVSPAGLVVWPEREDDVEVLYDLHTGEWIAPQAVRGLAHCLMPTLERSQLVFSGVEASWDRWVEVWQQDREGRGHSPDSVAPVQVLP